MEDLRFERLLSFLERVPAVSKHVGHGVFDDGNWWIKFHIDTLNPLAWNVIQEFGSVLNYVSLEERLPTTFFPVSPPPYLNGGPAEFLSWVIESTDASFSPNLCFEWLEGRFPDPVDDPSQWQLETG